MMLLDSEKSNYNVGPSCVLALSAKLIFANSMFLGHIFGLAYWFHMEVYKSSDYKKHCLLSFQTYFPQMSVLRSSIKTSISIPISSTTNITGRLNPKRTIACLEQPTLASSKNRRILNPVRLNLIKLQRLYQF